MKFFIPAKDVRQILKGNRSALIYPVHPDLVVSIRWHQSDGCKGSEGVSFAYVPVQTKDGETDPQMVAYTTGRPNDGVSPLGQSPLGGVGSIVKIERNVPKCFDGEPELEITGVSISHISELPEAFPASTQPIAEIQEYLQRQSIECGEEWVWVVFFKLTSPSFVTAPSLEAEAL